jgi:hypothetical protein
MDKHQGTIAVRSRSAPGEANPSGTVFMLFFPDHGVGRPAVEMAEQSAAAAVSEQLA